jgi:hypothetical protein
MNLNPQSQEMIQWYGYTVKGMLNAEYVLRSERIVRTIEETGPEVYSRIHFRTEGTVVLEERKIGSMYASAYELIHERDAITNMITAEDYIRNAAREYFGMSLFNAVARLRARELGTEAIFDLMKKESEDKFREESSVWMREYCKEHFSRFAHTRMYKILMGEIERPTDRAYHYQPRPF